MFLSFVFGQKKVLLGCGLSFVVGVGISNYYEYDAKVEKHCFWEDLYFIRSCKLNILSIPISKSFHFYLSFLKGWCCFFFPLPFWLLFGSWENGRNYFFLNDHVHLEWFIVKCGTTCFVRHNNFFLIILLCIF